MIRVNGLDVKFLGFSKLKKMIIWTEDGKFKMTTEDGKFKMMTGDGKPIIPTDDGFVRFISFSSERHPFHPDSR